MKRTRLFVSLVVIGLLTTMMVVAVSATTMQNPIVSPAGGGGSADPSVVFANGYYYYCRTLNDVAIGVAKAQRIQDIGGAPMITVYTPPAGTAYCKEIWAPELRIINGTWYIYFAADDGNNVNHRMYCLQANSADPQGSYTFRGKVTAPDNKWAIDGTVLQKTDGTLFFVWSGCEVNADFPQNLYIAPMNNPYTISGSKVLISTPSYAWEKVGAAINEGPAVLIKNGIIHIVYSASASWLNDYCLGRITCSNGNVMNPGSWVKNGSPVFSQVASSYGVGHNCFTKSPNGTEDWIVYHAFQNSGGGWGNRSVRAQKFTWSGNNPVFGSPLAFGATILDPSGTLQYSFFKFESINIAGNSIRHQNGRGRIDPGINQNADSQFYMVAGLADNTGVSFQSVNFPNCYLRHRNGEIWLDVNDGTQLFKDDATFYKVPGLANSSAVSFESKNFRGQYIRHRNGLLYREAVSDDLGRKDATFWIR